MAIRFATGWKRFFPLVGYHHVLMIIIAISIVLLCESGPTRNPPLLSEKIHTDDFLLPTSTPPSRLLISLPRHPRHLPHFPLLPKIPSSLRPRPSPTRRHNSNIQHRRLRLPRSTGWLLWNLHPTQRRSIPLQSKRLSACRSG